MPLATSVFTGPWPWRGCQCACVPASVRPRVFLAPFMSLINLMASQPTHKVTAAWPYFPSTPAGQSPNSFAHHHFSVCLLLIPRPIPHHLSGSWGPPFYYSTFVPSSAHSSPALWPVFHCKTFMAFHLTNVRKPIDSVRNQEAV